ncbi:MAG: hypothetical protein KF868_18085 [Acidobacteria bacterium]|nr:hypothetical protein [Acidobacteriota bacterium]
MRTIVSNTGPLLHLIESQLLALLEPAGEVRIPPAVSIEISRHARNWSLSQTPWIQIAPLIAPHDAQAVGWVQAGLLDVGEAEALALAQQLAADWFLTDDAAARVLASTLGVEAHGSLGVVLWAAATGSLKRDSALTALDRLAQSSLWISVRVLAEAREALNQFFQSDNAECTE